MEGLGNSETTGILQLIVCVSNVTPFPVSSHCFPSQLQLNLPQEFLLRKDFSREISPCLFLFQGTAQQCSELTSSTLRVTFLSEARLSLRIVQELAAFKIQS